VAEQLHDPALVRLDHEEAEPADELDDEDDHAPDDGGGVRFAVAGTHLDLAEAPRLRHVGELHAALDRYVPADVPAIVAGDINDVPGSASWQALTAVRTDAWVAAGSGAGFTSNPKNPRRRIDAVFADQRLPVISAEVVDTPDVVRASDHYPVLVELGLDG